MGIEKIILNKYGRIRLNYLKEHKKADYTIMLIDGTLNTHMLYWIGTMNFIKFQAEEIIFNELIYM